MKKLINFVLFQLAWLACVIGGNAVGTVTVAVVLVIHMLAISRNSSELKLIGLGALIGCIADQSLFLCGLLTTGQQGVIIPCWLVFLWLAFMTCIRHCMSWMRGMPVLAAICGAVFAPVSYYAGVRLEAISFGSAWLTPLAIGVIWAGFMPLAFWLEKKLVYETKEPVGENT